MASFPAPLVFPLGGGLNIGVAADVWAQDLLSVTFAERVKNDVLTQAPQAYSIAALDGGLPMLVTAVQTGNEVAPLTVYLVVTRGTVGKLYEITFQNLYAVTGAVVSPLPAKYIMRRTKQDSVIQSRPAMYDMSPDSTLRKFQQAIARQDDLIGGSRKDRIF